ncbi:forkhead box protein E1-like [Ruditapes philippinarum]|uniref:forkhead box protein E1-like n=1 Tax=Ruditapes philippinarum TaxID=129788 RepID=UPI00295B9AA0|nr:forkhead box protein E1-like [Ruditapes philippinarum]
MQRFTIEYLTGNTDSSYQDPTVTADAQIHVSSHDGLLTHIGSNFLHTSLHLEDVYSVINKDTEHSSTDISTHKQMTSPLVIDSSYTDVGTESSPLVIDSSFVSTTCDETSPSGTSSGSDVSPLHSPKDINTGMVYNYTLERATPSPNKDSGIESDNSPVSTYTNEDVKKSLRELEKKADKIKTSKKTTSSDKPSHSYIALIAMAILDSRDMKMTLGDIYRHIMDNHPYYNNEEKAWRNSIRYNLSINECFIKVGKDELAGKGNLWGIHSACIEDFKSGDFRRRQARRRAKKTIRGISSEDSTADYTARKISYQKMTPSYVNYHPYTTGLVRQQQMADYAHAYNGHYQMPSASYYNTLGHYQTTQHTPMGMTSYPQPTYDYTQQYNTAAYPSYEVTSQLQSDNGEKERQDLGLKYYSYSTTDTETGVPSNNKIEIL